MLEKERVVAERYYLSRFGSRWVECLSGTDEMKREFESAHPRYSTLADCETLSHTHTHTHARTCIHTHTHAHTHTHSAQNTTGGAEPCPTVRNIATKELPSLYPSTSLCVVVVVVVVVCIS